MSKPLVVAVSVCGGTELCWSRLLGLGLFARRPASASGPRSQAPAGTGATPGSVSQGKRGRIVLSTVKAAAADTDAVSSLRLSVASGSRPPGIATDIRSPHSRCCAGGWSMLRFRLLVVCDYSCAAMHGRCISSEHAVFIESTHRARLAPAKVGVHSSVDARSGWPVRPSRGTFGAFEAVVAIECQREPRRRMQRPRWPVPARAVAAGERCRVARDVGSGLGVVEATRTLVVCGAAGSSYDVRRGSPSRSGRLEVWRCRPFRFSCFRSHSSSIGRPRPALAHGRYERNGSGAGILGRAGRVCWPSHFRGGGGEERAHIKRSEHRRVAR